MKQNSLNDPIRDLKTKIKRLDIIIAKRPGQIQRLAKPLRPGAERQLEKDRTERAELQAQLDALQGSEPQSDAAAASDE